MFQHPDWGWGEIADIAPDQIFLRFPGGFGAWFNRTEFASRIPHKMPRSKSEAVVFQHMGYAVPEWMLIDMWTKFNRDDISEMYGR